MRISTCGSIVMRILKKVLKKMKMMKAGKFPSLCLRKKVKLQRRELLTGEMLLKREVLLEMGVLLWRKTPVGTGSALKAATHPRRQKFST